MKKYKKLKYLVSLLLGLWVVLAKAEDVRILLPYPTNIVIPAAAIYIPSLNVDPIVVNSNRAWALQGIELVGLDGVVLPGMAAKYNISTLFAVKADLDEAAQRFGYSGYGAVVASNLSQVIVWAFTHKAGATLGYSGEILTNWVDTVVSNLAVYLQE